MAITFSQKSAHFDAAGATTLTSTALTGAVTAGDAIIVPVWQFNAGGTNFVTSVTDSASNTWPASAAARLWTLNGNDRGVEIWVLPNASAKAAGTYTVTLHFAAASGEVEFDVVEFSGVATSSPIDTTGTAESAAGGAMVGALTPTTGASITNGGDLLVSIVTAGTGSLTSGFSNPPTNFTTIDIDQDDSAHVGGGSAYRILSGASGTQSCPWTWSGGNVNDNASAIVAILPSATAAFPVGQILL